MGLSVITVLSTLQGILTLAPVKTADLRRTVLQDEWGSHPQVTLVTDDGQAYTVALTSGDTPGEATFVLDEVDIPEGTVFSATWPENEPTLYGAAFREPLSGQGAVQSDTLRINLTHTSPFVLLESSVLGASQVEWAPFSPGIARESFDLSASGGEVLLMVPEGEYGVLCDGPSHLKTCVVQARNGGVCVSTPIPSAWLSLRSNVQAETLETRNLATGSGYVPGEYSGITSLGNGRYALVHNGARGGGIFRADIAFSGGRIQDVRITSLPGTQEAKKRRDPEGIAYVPRTGTLWVAGEKDQQILEYDLDGRPTGRAMPVPEGFGPSDLATGNGFESLSYSAGSGRMWTMTEEPLKTDALWFPAGAGRRMLRLLSFDEASRQLHGCRFYAMDPPEKTPAPRDTYVHGVSEVLALEDGTLLVLEREVYVPSYTLSDRSSVLSMLGAAFTRVKLYLVNPDTPGEAVLSKLLVKEFDTRFPGAFSLLMGADPVLANFEGMCLGPVLDGHPTVLLVNDSERGKGNSYARLQDYIKVLRF